MKMYMYEVPSGQVYLMAKEDKVLTSHCSPIVKEVTINWDHELDVINGVTIEDYEDSLDLDHKISR